MKKRIVALLLVVINLSLLLTACGGGSDNRPSGRWRTGADATIEFSGNNFTETFESSRVNLVRGLFPSGEYSREFIREDSVRGVGGTGLIRVYRYEATGTFTISDNRIEFVSSSGAVEVFDFARTENTIDIGSRRFTRA